MMHMFGAFKLGEVEYRFENQILDTPGAEGAGTSNESFDLSERGDKLQTTETLNVQDEDKPPNGAAATGPPATPATGPRATGPP